MAEVIYYFNGHSASDWIDPNNFNDGDIGVYATDLTNGHLHTFNSNTSPGTDLGTITKVELRVYAYGDGDDQIGLTPVFVGGNGDEHLTTPASSPAWGSYYEITTDTNAPEPWTWAAIAALGCIARYAKSGKANTMYASKVEIRVTYTEPAWEPPVSDIDVGPDPIDRATSSVSGFTLIDKNNPANASGILHTIKVYANANITGLRVGTFYTTNGNTLKCRDSVAIGDVNAGGRRTFTELSITVQAGDYIGCFYTSGEIEVDTGGDDGVWFVSGEYIDPNDETSYGVETGNTISLYGYGDIVGAEWKQVQYTSEPPTPNAWNQLKHTVAGGWNQIKYEGE